MSRNEQIRLCENDADVHAARLFAINAYTSITNSNIVNGENRESIYLGLYSLIISSIHILFSVFDTNSDGTELKYPQPIIRSAICASQFSVVFSEKISKIKYEEIFIVLICSISTADNYCRRINLARGNYNVHDKFQEWQKTQMPLVDEFDKVLREYNLLDSSN